MIIGDKSRFAAELELDKEYNGEWLYGKFCFWLGNKRIGNYELGTSLRDVLFSMTSIVRDSGMRENKELFLLETDELFNTLDKTLFGCLQSQFENTANEEQWAHHDINILVDIFDKWKMFIVENGNRARIIIGELNDNDTYVIFEELLKSGEFDDILLEVFNEINRLYDIECTRAYNM